MTRFVWVNRLRLLLAALALVAGIAAIVLSRGEPFPAHIHHLEFPSAVHIAAFPRIALLVISFFLWRDKLSSRMWFLLAGAGALVYVAAWIISLNLSVPGVVWYVPATILANVNIGLIYAFALTRRSGPVVYGEGT